MGKVSISYLFYFSRYKKKIVIKFLFRQSMMSSALRSIFDHLLQQWPTGRKRRADRNTDNWISWERKDLFRWNKKHFSWFLKGYHLVKKLKIAGTNLLKTTTFLKNQIEWIFLALLSCIYMWAVDSHDTYFHQQDVFQKF